MPSQSDKDAFLRTGGTTATEQIVPKFPPYPPEVKRRFPQMEQHEREIAEFFIKLNNALRGVG